MYFGLADNQHDLHDKNLWSGENSNAERRGLQIVATQRIHVGEEIRLDYGHRAQQTEQTAQIKVTAKKGRRTVL